MTWDIKRDVIEPMAEKIGRQAGTIKILEDELRESRRAHALTNRFLRAREDQLSKISELALALAKECSDALTKVEA